ncbi:multifunctional CCA addition/repair protein [Parasulfuritortus cantonensis]|uniref:Multifunctional CCA protein n=1 Tax=Parasulfuritortus cantonensis TaxID=2528202 RepID=A0A4R1BGM4_9PROT|nr:multifunctional CCA addition/repair protein [Parasulfuritortus cantonensis]TCJ16386.1 multifunctional CCA addition/repair protein [Parasulfuritortus cantonensis]
MRVYVVGGAVRDGLLGLPVQDRDYVVVGATPEEMTRLGFQPVGKDFPVFLHPDTHAEYALARTERKTARGYKGFQVYSAPDVTLADDLVRRDLTINAMAMDADGTLIDPHGGRADLAARVLRHVSPAFSEDPVRILRVARFAARFADFTVAPETMALMRTMVTNGEVDALVPERVWQELARGLMAAQPSRMLTVLRECGALARLIPELDALFGVPQPALHHPEIDTGVHLLMVIDRAAEDRLELAGRWAALLHDLGKGVTPAAHWPAHHGHEGLGAPLARAVSERLRAPAECRDLAVLAAREHGIVHRAGALRAGTMVELFERCDAFRRPERFAELLAVCAADARGRGGAAEAPYPQAARLGQALAAARAVDAGAVARAAAPGRIPEAVRQARVAAVRAALPTCS